jgi:peptidoglycan/LPS O-acetylase OafA/YrhL
MQSLNLQYNPRIDQLRWLAATIVFLFHFHLEWAVRRWSATGRR